MPRRKSFTGIFCSTTKSRVHTRSLRIRVQVMEASLAQVGGQAPLAMCLGTTPYSAQQQVGNEPSTGNFVTSILGPQCCVALMVCGPPMLATARCLPRSKRRSAFGTSGDVRGLAPPAGNLRSSGINLRRLRGFSAQHLCDDGGSEYDDMCLGVRRQAATVGCSVARPFVVASQLRMA